ncbi:ParA family protein [Bacillus paranthracis]|uniref:ParA family protein n=1 Tax=Bacillus paranthracis TaxID=2026186 RepID=UPI0021D0FB6D|nr:ParA family protein [Bacillus paranthracis]MCU4954486.1 ParA family protein [Bacillus paranthracis]
MGKVISFFSTKGGVAKSVSSVMMSHVLEEMGYSVLLIDLCQNGDVSNTLGFNRKEFPGRNTYDWVTEDKTIQEVIVQVPDKNIFFIPSDNRVDKIEDWIDQNVLRGKDEVLKKKIDPLKGAFDYIICDCHPSQNSMASVMALISSDFVYVMTTLDGNDLDGAVRSVEIVQQLQREGVECDYEILFAKFVTNDFGASYEWLEEAKENFKLNGMTNFSNVNIPFSRIIPQFTAKKKSFEDIKEHQTAGKVVKAYQQVARNLVEKEVVKNG